MYFSFIGLRNKTIADILLKRISINRTITFILVFDICSVRMIMAVTNEYRQVKVHRKKKFSQDNAGNNNMLFISSSSVSYLFSLDVHSTTNRYGGSI